MINQSRGKKKIMPLSSIHCKHKTDSIIEKQLELHKKEGGMKTNWCIS